MSAVRASPGQPTSVAGSMTVEELCLKLADMRPPGLAPGRMSYQEFLDWSNEDTLAEWVDGEAIMTSPASRRHQDIADFLTGLIRAFVEYRNQGLVLSGPFQMKLESGREPDLIFVAREHLARLRETYLDGPADLAVEIVSPESVGRDRGEKFYEYERGGVPEYWMIDPQTRRAEFYQLASSGQYRLIEPEADGIYRSASIRGFWLRVDWLWQTPLIPALRALAEIVGLEAPLLQAFERRLSEGGG